MHRNRRAKIVATVGPASAEPAMLKALFLAGVDTFRMNFSHGAHEDHAKVHAAIRSLEAEVGRPIGIRRICKDPKFVWVLSATAQSGSRPEKQSASYEPAPKEIIDPSLCRTRKFSQPLHRTRSL